MTKTKKDKQELSKLNKMIMALKQDLLRQGVSFNDRLSYLENKIIFCLERNNGVLLMNYEMLKNIFEVLDEKNKKS